MPKKTPERVWLDILTKPHHSPLAFLPSDPRCAICHVPFGGVGGGVARMVGWKRWNKNPGFCNFCYQGLPAGGAEVDVAVFFADLRGSTALGESLGPTAFAGVLNAFYRVATDTLVPYGAIIDKMIGDEVMALFVPVSSAQYRQHAVSAAVDLMREYRGDRSGEGHPLLGIGLHAGPAFVGKVGHGEVTDFTALGDTVNTAARIQHEAGPGEIVMSEALYREVQDAYPGLDTRAATVRGKQEPLALRVLRAAGTPQ